MPHILVAMTAAAALAVTVAFTSPFAKVDVGTKPYLSQLRQGPPAYSMGCTGALVTSSIVLFAGSCIKSYPSHGWVAIGPAYKDGKEDNGEWIQIESKTFHPRLSTTTFEYDVAVVKLVSPSKHDPVVILWDDAPPGSTAWVRGWMPRNRTDRNLYEAPVRIETTATCRSQFPWLAFKTIQCASNDAIQNCFTGIDGPLTMTTKGGTDALLGLLSLQLSCFEVNRPSDYSRLSKLRDFVEPLLCPLNV
ncbi:hypothetical protein DYB28_011301 [Aphanomyces astaci]|uniref:Peptidase S1 domain-containing protein n=1 Tax=Aphanomyces astaci TaxID=112090 RepID=A0A9X8HD96_APHAT|nr:hypothetical protein DYB28_011301 [Aphanomyces astaci]